MVSLRARSHAKEHRPKDIPDKPYFKIGEVAEIAAVAPSVLRFWETEFPALRPEKTRTNQRVYARKHVDIVLRIRELLYERGFTIAGAREKLKDKRSEIVENLKKEVRELLLLVDE